MQSLYLRLGQATPLTYSQLDENFIRIKSAIDALEISVAGAGLGTVTSVGLALPNIFTVSGSPVTTAGSLTASLASQTQNLIFASPDGTSGQPTFRALLNADLPTVSIAKGGLGLTTVATNNQIIASNGTSYEGRTISVGTGLTLTQGTGSVAFALDLASINITSLGGVLTTPQGGTGISTAPANGELLIGNGTVWQKATLTAGSGISIVNGAGSITISTSLAGVGSLNGLTGVLAIGVGTTGTDVNVTTPTSSDITLNIPSASASNRGALTSTDWSTFNGKVGGSGTASYITKFTASGTVGNSVLYEDGVGRIGLGLTTPTSDLHIQKANATANVETTSGVAAIFRVSSTSTSSNVAINSGGNVTTTNCDLTVNTGFKTYSTGNAQFLKGFAIDGFVYFNTTGNYTFSTNEQYGVILGTGSDATMSVALPSTPMDGQEICILCEEAKTLTLTSTKTIYGHNAGVSIPITLTGGGSGAASLIAKYASGAGGGTGAWFITGL